MIRRPSFFILHVTLPLVMGGLIYVGWRDENLLMFSWFHTLGLSSVVEELRAWSLNHNIPEWVRYSLPDGCWVYSIAAHVRLVWGDDIRGVIWGILGCSLGAVSEVLQGVGLLQGTFDWSDLLVYCLAPPMAWLVGHFWLYEPNPSKPQGE